MLIQGVLFKKSAAGSYLRCLENDQWGQVLEDLHEGTCGNHSRGRSLSNRALRMGYYWPTMKKDAIRYVTKCDSCQGHEGMTHKPCEILHPTLTP